MAKSNDVGFGGRWEWGVAMPTFRDGPMDRVILSGSRTAKDGGEAAAREDYENLIENNRRFPESAIPVKLVKRKIPNWVEVEGSDW